MRCPRCGARSKVYKTKPDGLAVIRWRICQGSRCAATFYTKEVEAERRDPAWDEVPRVKL